MSSVHKAYVDTNIFIIAFEAQDELSVALSTLLLRSGRIASGVVTSIISYAELMAGPYRDADEALLVFYRAMFAANQPLETVPVDKSLLDLAARLRAKYRVLKLPDAIHVASAIRAGCPFLISRDVRFPASFNVVPEPDADPAEVKVLLPDPEGLLVLRRLLAS